MTETKKTVGIYTGKVMGAEGPQKKDPTKYFRKWKLSFKPNEESDKSFTMGVFQNGSKAEGATEVTWEDPIDIKEGEWYTITYTESPGEYQGAPITYKNLKQIQQGKDPNVQVRKDTPLVGPPIGSPEAEAQAEQETEVVSSGKLAAKDWVNFQTEYNKNMEGNAAKTDLHMLGAYVANKEAAMFADIIALCKKNFQ